MVILGLSKLVNSFDNYINQRILKELEDLSDDDELEKIKILSNIINPDLFTKLNIGLSTPDIFIDSYHRGIDTQIKELKKLCFQLKNKKKVSGLLIAGNLNVISAYEYFTSSEKCFIAPAPATKELLELCKEFSEIITVLKRSQNDVDLENYFSLRSYISNVAFNLESLARVVMRK